MYTNLPTSQGYIFRILQHFATKLCSFSNFDNFFPEISFVIPRLKIFLKRKSSIKLSPLYIYHSSISFYIRFIVSRKNTFMCGQWLQLRLAVLLLQRRRSRINSSQFLGETIIQSRMPTITIILSLPAQGFVITLSVCEVSYCKTMGC